MGIDAAQLDAEADTEFAQMMGQQPAGPAPQDKPQDAAPTAENVPSPKAGADPEPVAFKQPPAPEANDDWQDKYTKAEESRKNAHALMTQSTQKAAGLERSSQDMQQQLGAMQQQLNQLSQPQSAPPPQANTDQFKELREDYEELNPVFNRLDETAQRNQQFGNINLKHWASSECSIIEQRPCRSVHHVLRIVHHLCNANTPETMQCFFVGYKFVRYTFRL